jgi:hypothetical protein
VPVGHVLLLLRRELQAMQELFEGVLERDHQRAQ